MTTKNEELIVNYVDEVRTQFESGHAKEHAYRPALERLMASFENVTAVNDPKRSENGNPDFIFLKTSNKNIILGYAEAKDIDISLDKTEKTDQMHRYAGYENLFLTNYLEFRFYQNGNKYQTIEIGHLKDELLITNPETYHQLADELSNFLELPPERIKSGKRLAEIMGAKARRIRDNVLAYLEHSDEERNQELEKMYNMMKELLVHDLTADKFADMYSQTLVYGLFVARYGDSTPDSFTRAEARDLVPASNPFLREFFDHIVGPRFDKRLAYIVDELCEVFSVSDVNMLVNKHLRLFEIENEKDPIIHFYEDFLKEYDPSMRKQMGAYYTPLPVVRFIVNNVDEILKNEFGINKGLADTEKKKITITRQGKTFKQDVHRIQVLDPAVGTATFLNETIKHIYQDFKGQEGRWPSYVKSDLLPRLHGFELMMAPYTIAHLKLGMTLKETGVKEFSQRLGVYLTNTLEEGVKKQPDLFSFGLADIVSHEAEEASRIKHEKPIMVIMGNPPYSVSSNNKSDFIQNLLKDYKKDLNERNIQPLGDDYIKFIRFAEDMISKNGDGIMAMITNNSYTDGVIHRQMRKHLLQTFDSIYITDLHGNSKRKEKDADGGIDENVFDIQQGVSIIIAVKKKNSRKSGLGKLYYQELFGSRKHKFSILTNGLNSYKNLDTSAEGMFFIPKDFSNQGEYSSYIPLDNLFIISSVGIVTSRDDFLIGYDDKSLAKKFVDITSDALDDIDFESKYRLNSKYFDTSVARNKTRQKNEQSIVSLAYRPFDKRSIIYNRNFIERDRFKVMQHMLHKDNVALIMSKISTRESIDNIQVVDTIIELKTNSHDRNSSIFPLYLYHDNGTKTANFNPTTLKEFSKNLNSAPSPEDVFDYIYAILHSPRYRKKYKEFLKIDFPRIPAPKDDAELSTYSKLGRDLRRIHLMTSPIVNDLDTTYLVSGENEVDKIKYEGNRVNINETQYFGNVPELAWDFYIGGYQPAQKWLKDRKGHILTNGDIEHYQRIIKVLVETDRVMREIDALHS
jgi:predicted helicase